MLRIRDIAWAAGLLEGEGYFDFHPKNGLMIEMTMTDEDVVGRFHSVVGCGTRIQRGLPSGKTAFRWALKNQHEAAGLMMTLLPLMGERRAQKIRDSLTAWRERPLPKSMWTHCKNGHELIGDNLRIYVENGYQKRRCIKCGVLRQRKHRGSNDATDPVRRVRQPNTDREYRLSIIEDFERSIGLK